MGVDDYEVMRRESRTGAIVVLCAVLGALVAVGALCLVGFGVLRMMESFLHSGTARFVEDRGAPIGVTVDDQGRIAGYVPRCFDEPVEIVSMAAVFPSTGTLWTARSEGALIQGFTAGITPEGFEEVVPLRGVPTGTQYLRVTMIGSRTRLSHNTVAVGELRPGVVLAGGTRMSLDAFLESQC